MRKIHITWEVDPDRLQAQVKRGQQWSTRNRAQALFLVSRGNRRRTSWASIPAR